MTRRDMTFSLFGKGDKNNNVICSARIVLHRTLGAIEKNAFNVGRRTFLPLVEEYSGTVIVKSLPVIQFRPRVSQLYDFR